MRVRKYRILVVLGAALLVAQACSSSSATTAPAASAPPPATAAPATAAPATAAPVTAAPATPAPSPSAEPVTLNLLEHQDLRIAVMKKIIPVCQDQLKQQGMNVTVNLVDAQVANDDEFKQKVVAGYQGDSPPDITSYPGNWVPDFAAAGYLADLTDKLNAWPDWNAHFYQVLRDRSKQADGKYWSMPRHGTVMEFFVRKDVLDKLGVSTAQPTSWDDLVARLKEITDKSGGLSAITLPAGKQWGGGTFDEGFRLMLLGTGFQPYDPSTNKWTVTNQAWTDVFTLYSTLQKNGLLPTKALLDPNPWEPTKYDGFTGTTSAGKAVPVAPPVTTQGSWGWVFDWGPTGARPIPDLTNKVITWAVPSNQAGQQPYVLGSEDWMWTISAKSKNQDSAWAFLQCLNTGQPLAEDVAAVGNVAPRDDISTISPYADMPYLVAMEKLLPNGKSLMVGPGIDKIQQAVSDATEQILLGKLDGPGAADFFAKDATDLLGPDAVQQ